jgi:hypothetical protein
MTVPIDRTKRAIEPFRLALATQRQGNVVYMPYARQGLQGMGAMGSIVDDFKSFLNSIGIGTAHLLADQWVGQVQNPFGQALAFIVDAKDASLSNGTATCSSVMTAKNAVVDLWNKYKTTAERWAASGGSYRTVIDQSYATLTPLINQILADMTAQANTLGSCWSAPGPLTPLPPITTTGPSGTFGGMSGTTILLIAGAVFLMAKKKIF